MLSVNEPKIGKKIKKFLIVKSHITCYIHYYADAVDSYGVSVEPRTALYPEVAFVSNNQKKFGHSTFIPKIMSPYSNLSPAFSAGVQIESGGIQIESGGAQIEFGGA